MDLSKLEVVIRTSWGKETSSDPDNWTEENPARGQCAVTALIVNDYFCGKIVWANATTPEGKEISHYFNLIDGKEIDLTRGQFPAGTLIPEGVDKKRGYETTRDYVLSFKLTQDRYTLLKKRVEMNLS